VWIEINQHKFSNYNCDISYYKLYINCNELFWQNIFSLILLPDERCGYVTQRHDEKAVKNMAVLKHHLITYFIMSTIILILQLYQLQIIVVYQQPNNNKQKPYEAHTRAPVITYTLQLIQSPYIYTRWNVLLFACRWWLILFCG